ncbi:unnamed protein product [Moneuplotes crassus]|uniref:folate gamma-glutamyl hydrolase n=1 Tax=Euplotes crassus TaxID=5936 RepID=A0AAD1UNF7_EUPCR|nr:unnamed protein product [Moneuplotes crassus]
MVCLVQATAGFVFEDLPSVKELIREYGYDQDLTLEELKEFSEKKKSLKLTNKVEEYAEDIPNSRPIIAILTQPRTKSPPYNSYIMAAYAKFVFQAGGRVIPLHWDNSFENITATLKRVNGVIIAGGGQVIQDPISLIFSDYTNRVKFVLDQAKEINDEGSYFPVWAICQGFQQLSIIEGPEYGRLSHATAKNIPRKLEFVRDENGEIIRGRIYKEMSDDLIKALETKEIAFHNNDFRLDPFAYKYDVGLKKYNVLAYSRDRDGRPMVTSIEHKDYPIYSNQWHPEKNSFVWKETILASHSKLALQLTQYMSDFFVTECRKNTHKYGTPEEERRAIIENHPVEVTDGSLADIYLFY